MKRDYWKIAAVLALLVAASSVEGPTDDEAVLCHTDSECQKFCPEEDHQLPPDHPLYCDGGPQGSILPASKVWL